MQLDIRVLVSFRGHPKRVKLKRRLGSDGIVALLDLWLSARENRPSGILTDMTEEDICIAASWNGDEQAFIDALVETGWLSKREDGAYELHDWSEHQPYATNQDSRCETAARNAHARWKRERGGRCAQDPCPYCDPHAAGTTLQDSDSHATGMRPASGRSAPVPLPSPLPETTGSNLSSPEKEEKGSKTFSARERAEKQKSGNGHGGKGDDWIGERQFAFIASQVRPWDATYRELNAGSSAEAYAAAFNRQNFGVTWERFEQLRQKFANSS